MIIKVRITDLKRYMLKTTTLVKVWIMKQHLITKWYLKMEWYLKVKCKKNIENNAIMIENIAKSFRINQNPKTDNEKFAFNQCICMKD